MSNKFIGWFLSLWVFVILTPMPTTAAVMTFEETAEAYIGDNQTKNDARYLATLEAKRRALEKAGVYVESLTLVKNSQLQRDEVLAFTAGITQAKIIKEVPLVSGNTFGLRVTAQVTVDQSILSQRINEFRASQNWQEAYHQLLKQNQQLENTLKQLNGQATPTSLQSQYLALQDYADSLQAYDRQAWEEARLKATQALEKWPTMAVAYNNRARAWLQLKKLDLARQDYQKALQLDPRYLSPYLNLALLFSQNPETQPQALQLCQQAQQYHPNHPRIAEIQGFLYSQTQRWQEALNVYNEALKQTANQPELYYNRAVVHQALLNWSAALSDYQSVLTANPLHRKALNNRGAVWLRLNKPQEALNDYNQAINLEPNYANAYYNRGLAYHQLRQCALAEKDYQKACQLGMSTACQTHCR